MAPRIKISREEILKTAYDMIEENGVESLKSRDLALRLSCSTQPVFYYFDSINDLIEEVKLFAKKKYNDSLIETYKAATDKPFKIAGLFYIKYAKEHTNIFKLLFMSKSTEKYDGIPQTEADNLMNEGIAKATGLTKKCVGLLRLETWIFVHGIATMIASGSVEFDDEIVSRMLTDNYLGTVYMLKKVQEEESINNDRNK